MPSSEKSEELARAVRELAGLLSRAGRVDAAERLDEEAAAIAAGQATRGLAALRSTNAIHAGLAAARSIYASESISGLIDDVARALRN